MPKVKLCKITVDGAAFEASLRVDSKGVFKITRPGTSADWSGSPTEIEGPTLEEVEARWAKDVRDFAKRTRTERKVIVVRFDSNLRTGGLKNFFTGRETMIVLEAAVALEITTRRGEVTDVSFREHPDFQGLHSPEQPFPRMMRLDSGDLRNGRRHDWTVVPWTEELEAAIVRACQGILAVVELLDGVLTCPDTLIAAAGRLDALPSPQPPTIAEDAEEA